MLLRSERPAVAIRVVWLHAPAWEGAQSSSPSSPLLLVAGIAEAKPHHRQHARNHHLAHKAGREVVYIEGYGWATVLTEAEATAETPAEIAEYDTLFREGEEALAEKP